MKMAADEIDEVLLGELEYPIQFFGFSNRAVYDMLYNNVMDTTAAAITKMADDVQKKYPQVLAPQQSAEIVTKIMPILELELKRKFERFELRTRHLFDIPDNVVLEEDEIHRTVNENMSSVDYQTLVREVDDLQKDVNGMVQSNAAMKEELKLIQETEENLNQMINLMKSQAKEMETIRAVILNKFSCLKLDEATNNL